MNLESFSLTLHDVSMTYVIFMTLQAWKMVSLDATTFHDRKTPCNVNNPQTTTSPKPLILHLCKYEKTPLQGLSFPPLTLALETTVMQPVHVTNRGYQKIKTKYSDCSNQSTFEKMALK